MRMVDFAEVRDLARDLESAGDRADSSMRQILKRGAMEIKKGMRRDFSGHSFLPEVPRFVSFDGGGFGGDIDYEIGVDKRGQGNLANILAYGDGTHGPYLEYTAPLHREAPQVEKHTADAGEQAPLGRKRR